MEQEEKLMKKWVKVYPIYIDKAIKLSEGRKVSQALGIENPTVNDINAVCTQFLNLKSKIEDHSHPKDWMKRGRIIVELKSLDKKPIDKELSTSKPNPLIHHS